MQVIEQRWRPDEMPKPQARGGTCSLAYATREDEHGDLYLKNTGFRGPCQVFLALNSTACCTAVVSKCLELFRSRPGSASLYLRRPFLSHQGKRRPCDDPGHHPRDHPSYYDDHHHHHHYYCRHNHGGREPAGSSEADGAGQWLGMYRSS